MQSDGSILFFDENILKYSDAKKKRYNYIVPTIKNKNNF